MNDGWTITDDPLSLPWGKTRVEVDLGAERLIVAEKGTRKIAVEIKSFVSRSRIEDLEDALGQLMLYRHILAKTEPERQLYLAIREDVFSSFFSKPHVEELRQAENIRVIIFDPATKEITQWIN